jgi:hypothetical protein
MKMFEGDAEVRARATGVEEMLRRVCGDGEYPWFVSDQATILDVCTLTPDEIVDRLASSYGSRVQPFELCLPIWKLLDRLTNLS